MSNTLNTPQEIKENVREYYAARIQANDTSCGSNGNCCGNAATTTEISLYGTETLQELSPEVNTTSYGCGNPIALASLSPGEVVVDLGSGAGLDALLAARRVGSEGYVYGVDMTDAMLDVARRNAEKAGVAHVEFRKGDIEDLPLPDQSVDVIISNCVINLAPNKEAVFSEAFRVLKPGARLAVSDIVVDGTLDDLPLSESEIRAALSWAGCIAGALSVADYTHLLEVAGFTDIDISVRHRYTINDLELERDAPDVLTNLDPETLQQLLQRFTSSSISARRPA